MQAPVIYISLDEEDVPRTINGQVKVHMIALKYEHGESAETIAEHYDISLADVYGALAYFYDNRLYFEQREREAQPFIDEAKRYTSELKAKIQERMAQSKDD